MSDEQVTGASMPEGIEVDKHSAYFGITDSSDLIERLAQTDRLNGLGEFLTLSSDLLLKQPNLDLDTTAARLQVEAGEMYWLLSGPFQLLSWTDPIRYYLGMEDSEGNPGGPDPGLSGNEISSLDSFNDPFRLLRMLAIGHVVGGLQELDQYIANFEAWMRDVSANRIRFIALQKQLDQTLATTMSGGEASSLSALTGGPVVRVEVKTPEGLPEPTPEPAPAAETPAPTPAPSPAPAQTPAATPAPTPAPEPTAAGVSIADAFDVATQPAATAAPAPAPAPATAAPAPVETPPTPVEPEITAPPAEPALTPAPAPTPDQAPAPVTTAAPAEPPVATLAPKRAPISATPAPAPAQQPVAPAPTMAGAASNFASAFAAPAAPAPVEQTPARSGRVRGAGLPGVHHVVQTGLFCATCSIGVEHHWRMCPICSSKL